MCVCIYIYLVRDSWMLRTGTEPRPETFSPENLTNLFIYLFLFMLKFNFTRKHDTKRLYTNRYVSHSSIRNTKIHDMKVHDTNKLPGILETTYVLQVKY